MNPAIKIGELAKLTGFSVQTIRYYEREGVVEKAATKFADAKVMTTTYQKIISKLEEDRQGDF